MSSALEKIQGIDLAQFLSLEPGNILNLHIFAQIANGILFVLCAFSVSHTYNAGFNVVLTAVLYFAYAGVAYYVINKDKRPVYVGGVIGGGIMIVFLSLMTSIFWGQLSVCEKVDQDIEQYSCDNKVGYRAVCLFAVIMFIIQFSFTVVLINLRGEVLKEASEYEEISSTLAGEDEESFDEKPIATAPSADL